MPSYSFFFFVPATNVPAQPDDTMTIIGMYDTVPLIHEAKKSGATLLEFLRGVRQENAFAARSNVLLLGAELSDLGLGNGEPLVHVRFFFLAEFSGMQPNRLASWSQKMSRCVLRASL